MYFHCISLLLLYNIVTMKKQIGVETHCDSDTGTSANDIGSESALSTHCTLQCVLTTSHVTAVYVNVIWLGWDWRLSSVWGLMKKKPRGHSWGAWSPLVDEAGVPTPGLCLRFPSSVSPHGAPSNSPQQGSMRERAETRVGSWMEGDKLTCGVLWGECPTSRPLITIR